MEKKKVKKKKKIKQRTKNKLKMFPENITPNVFHVY